jgi:hypothetical protein
MVLLPLMIVDNLYFVCITLGPYETDSPLLVDSDAVLALSVTSKQLQSIPGNCLQVRQAACALNLFEFSYSYALDALKARDSPAIEQCLRVL